MNNRVDANPADLQVVIDAIRGRIPQDAEVYVFGSRAKWTAKHHSDLDICIKANTRIPRADLLDIKEALEDSDLPWRVDIVDWAELDEKFRSVINRDGVPLTLGVMPQSWKKRKWGDIVSLEYGKAIRGYQNADAPFRVFGSNGPIGWTENALAQGPGVILGRKGAYRGVHFSRDPFSVIDTAYYVKAKSELDMRWLYYAMIHHKLGEIDDGSPIPSTTRAAVYVRDVEVPPLTEQRAIAATLGALDDKIELNRRMNATLESMARALFRDWFVDFGPTRAKMEGRAPYLAPDLWSLFPDRLDDDGKPEGWEVSTIGGEVRVVGGSTPSTKEAELWDGGINWATPKDLSNLSSPVLLDTGRTISKAGLAKISSGLLPVGTVLLSSRAPIGYLAIAEVPVAINQGFIAMICDRRLSNAFVWLWTLENMDAIIAKANGSTFQEISKGNFRPLPVIAAPAPILRAFDTIAKPLYQRIADNERESRTLAQTRDLLLPRLMSGELRVADVDQGLEAML